MHSMSTHTLEQQDQTHLWHPYTPFSAFQDHPLPIIVKGEGCYLIDTDGNRYLDAISSWWACALGHSHPRITTAIQEQTAELQHSILGNLSHPKAIELARKLSGLMPTSDRHVFFCSDGASANEAAMKIALQYWHNIGKPERNKLVHLTNAYHGDTLGTVAVGYLEHFHKPFKTVLPHTFSINVPYTQAEETLCLNKTAELFDEHKGQIAALIIEPLCQGSAGMKMYSATYLKQLVDLCHEHDILLIDDEIAMGMGRTGKMFAFEHAGIDPDIVCLGKAVTAGYLPLSATIVNDRLYHTFSDTLEDHTFYHGHTFGGNPIACAAALETLTIFKEEKIIAMVLKVENIFKHTLLPLTEHAAVSNLRILGAIAAFDIAGSHGTEKAQELKKQLLKKRILLRPLGNTVYLMPPLNIPEEDLNRLLSTVINELEICILTTKERIDRKE